MKSFLRPGPSFASPAALLLSLLLLAPLGAQIAEDRSVVPASIRDPILLEYSGSWPTPMSRSWP